MSHKPRDKRFMESRGCPQGQPQHAMEGNDGREWGEEKLGCYELMGDIIKLVSKESFKELGYEGKEKVETESFGERMRVSRCLETERDVILVVDGEKETYVDEWLKFHKRVKNSGERGSTDKENF